MTDIVIRGSERYTFNSNDRDNLDLCFHVPARTAGNVLVILEGNRHLEMKMEVKVEESANVRFMVINHVENSVAIKEHFDIERDSNVLEAHCQLEGYDVMLGSNYDLNGEGANLKVQTASLSGGHKIFMQKTFHHKGNTEAHVNNYGVVWAEGHCELIVENTIEKGSHKASTHQTSRLLTYDKTAKGRILPILYIYDNEVQASHAASLGQPDDEQVYYLESRGLTRSEAVQLIVKGYLLPITTVMDDEELEKLLTEEIEQKVQKAC